MKTTHTPGPWKFDVFRPDAPPFDTHGTITVVSPWSDKNAPGSNATFGDYRGAHICSMQFNSGVPSFEQAEANAKLIAAAPELLEALLAVRSMLNEDDDTAAFFNTEQIDAAIKKATL